MSIAKAAVIEFYKSKSAFVYSGDLDFFHRVINRAGAEHIGPATNHAVLACIRSSSLWKQHGTIPGWGNRRANTYVPKITNCSGCKNGDEFESSDLSHPACSSCVGFCNHTASKTP